jgi:hypothetical protein
LSASAHDELLFALRSAAVLRNHARLKPRLISLGSSKINAAHDLSTRQASETCIVTLTPYRMIQLGSLTLLAAPDHQITFHDSVLLAIYALTAFGVRNGP